MSGLKKRLGWIAASILFLFAAFNVTRAIASAPPTSPRAKDTEKSKRTTVKGDDEKLMVPEGTWLSGQGVVEPADRETKVASRVAGRIAKVLVKEGDHLSQGDAIAEIDSEVEKATVAAASADVEEAEASLLRSSHGDRIEDRQGAEADARAAAARAAESRGIAERLEKAAAGGGATGDEVDRAKKQAEIDKATAEQSQARERASIAGSRYEDVLAAKARVLSAKARLDEAKARLEEKTVRSPLDGDVLSLKVRAGEYIQPGGDPIAIVGDLRVLRARIDIDERDIGKLQLGAKVIVRASAYLGVDFSAKVVEIGKRMGRKNVRTDDPVERNDTKILEVVVELEAKDRLVVGQRVVGFVASGE